MNQNIVVGIDIGGSHITAALVNLETHAIIENSTVRRHVDSKAGVKQIIEEWCAAIADCKACHPDASGKIGIAMPGPFDYENGISLIKGLDKYEALYNLNVKELLAQQLQVTAADIVMMNDASCFLKGEVFAGAARDASKVIGITLGTGLGSATCKNAVVYDGDLYYTPYKDSTAEEYLSSRWFIKRYEELSGITAKNVKVIGENVVSEPLAGQVFKEFGNNLGEVLAAYIKKHNTQTVVIGGNIINAWDLFIAETKQVLHKHGLEVLLLKAGLGEEAALLGAASLCTV